MKIIRVYEYGDVDKLILENADKPIPNDNEVLVNVKAIGVNFADTRRRLGNYVEPTPLPFIPGLEVSGVIEEVGKNVKEFGIGDRVVSIVEAGYAEYVVVEAKKLTLIPEEVSFEVAASLPLQGLTAHYLLKEMARMRKNESVLVHAAAGGVGTLAVQLAKIYGAKKVIATASSNSKLEIARSLGADLLINYTDKDWHQQIISNGMEIDVVLEMVGDEVFHNSLKCLAHFGRMIVFGRASGKETLIDPRQLMSKNQTVSGFLLTGFQDDQMNREILQEMFEYIKKGKMKVIVGGVYSLEEAAKAHKLIENRSTHGKILLKPTLD